MSCQESGLQDQICQHSEVERIRSYLSYPFALHCDCDVADGGTSRFDATWEEVYCCFSTVLSCNTIKDLWPMASSFQQERPYVD